MVEDLEKEFEVKSRMLDKLQQALDERIEQAGRLERDLGEKTVAIEGLERSLEEKTSAVDELRAELDKKTAEARQLDLQLQTARSELLQQKAEIDSMKNLLSYKIGKSFGDRFGGAPGVRAFEKSLSYVFRQNYEDLSNSKAPEADDQNPGPVPEDPDKAGDPGKVPAGKQAGTGEPAELTGDQAKTEEPAELTGDQARTGDPGKAPAGKQAGTEDPTGPPSASDGEDLHELLRPKMSAEERDGLVAKLQQRLASTSFAHGESLDLGPAQLEMCVDSRSNMLDEWELACLCSCIRNFEWKDDDYLIEIGTNIGRTAVFMAKILRQMDLDTKIISIDPFSLAADKAYNPKGNYSHYVTMTRQQDVHDTCIPVTAFSQNIPNVFRQGVGVLLVDGSHQYEDARKDLDHYSRLLRQGGYVFVDDYSLSYPGVYRAFEEWLSASDGFELSYKGEYFVIAKKIDSKIRIGSAPR